MRDSIDLAARRGLRLVLSAGAIAIIAACSPPPPPPPMTDTALATLEAKTRRLAPSNISADVERLPSSERQALTHLLRAAEVMDGLFLEQVWAGNTALLTTLAADRTPLGQARLHYFLINKGPWSRLDHDEGFLGDRAPAKPPQANFYPADAHREDVKAWMDSLTGPARADAAGFFSVIRRGADGRLMAVPYSVEYRNALTIAASYLRQAAAATTQPTLKKYLELRADAFLSNDYYASDVAWMELDASIEPTIGPYETYEDKWFEFKAAFEAIITLRDDAETRKLDIFGGELQGLEDALPIPAEYRNPKLGAMAPMRVVNVVLTAGDANRGVQTAAFNLPNDERVTKEKGSKRVMLKNIQEAKFQRVLQPIAAIALAAGDRPRVSFDAFFTHILMHELMHGLGPLQVKKTGQSIRDALTDTYGALEEAKADISGLWALHRLADKGVVPAGVARSMYPTYLASLFRSIRFGVNEAHGKGVAVQLNYLLEAGAIVANADGTFSVEETKVRDAVSSLTALIMTIQAEGNYRAAEILLKTKGVVPPSVQAVLDKLGEIPVDIEPIFRK